jgi:kynureninase
VTSPGDRGRAAELDAADPLAAYRHRFVNMDPSLIYLDGNSLGRLPVTTRDRLRAAVDDEWGTDLIRGWDRWIDLAARTGDLIGSGVIGADPGEVLVCDSTSVNLYKLAVAALDARPDRHTIVTDDDNFPTDRYVLQGIAAARGLRLRLIATDINEGLSTEDVATAVDDDTALACLSHVAYRSGAVADLGAVTDAVHDAGALMLWDLCHSAGAVDVALRPAGVDLAVGCTYKHLNGGPGAPAFLYVRTDLQQLRQPIWGWFGQRDQFAMGAEYEPVDGIERFAVGTPGVLGLYAALEGVRLTAEAGIGAIAAKTRALASYSSELFDLWLEPLGFSLASPRDLTRRGAHLTLAHPQAWQVCQALKANGVIPDFRTPDRLRLGFAPLYTSFAEVFEGMSRLRELVASGAHHAFDPAPARVT